MLDDLIAARVDSQNDGRRIALALQRMARFVVIPAAMIMLGGLVAFGVAGGLAEEPSTEAVLPLRAVFSRAALTPVGAMSLGLLALALLPMANVLFVLGDNFAHRRWADAGAAAAVAAILIIGIVVGQS